MLRHAFLLSLALILVGASFSYGSEMPRVRIRLDVGNSVELGADSDWVIGIHHSGTRPARVPAARSWKVRAIDGPILRVADDTFVREFSDTLFVHPVPGSGGSVIIGGKRYRGEALLFARDGELFVVNVIDLESYLLGVVPLEIGSQNDARYEAVKAQAIAARSYTLSTLGRWRRDGYDLKDTVEDQAYGGRDVETERCTRAVEETRGVVATYDRVPILAYYSSTSGGYTASPSEVWGRDDRPYLQAVRDKTSRVDDSFCDISPFYKWTEVWPIADFERFLTANLPSQIPSWSREEYGAFRDLKILSRTKSKRVGELELRFERGSIVLRGDALRWAIRRPDGGGLRSTLFERVGVRRSGGRPVEVTIIGRGYGHGVGLCQYGAMGMSQVGYDYTQILRFYYRGTELRKYY